MITYFVVGWLASSVFKYRELFASSFAGSMRSFDSPWVPAGPSLQCVRGAMFGLVLWPLRALWLDEARGWLTVWLLFLGLAIFGTAAAPPGSFEGVIYTELPLSDHVVGLPETLTQTLLFCVLFQRWYRHPNRFWNPIMIAGVVIICLFGILGVLATIYPQAFRNA